jgi:hypothetical protein
MRTTIYILIVLFVLVGLIAGCSDKGTKPDTTIVSDGVKNPVKSAQGLTFFFTPDPGTETRNVYLMGTFNGWTPDDEGMQLQAGNDGRWSVTVRLDKGRHEYKFVVNGKQVPDKTSKEVENDGVGGIKSYVTVQ